MKNYFIKNKDKTFKLQNLILLIIIFALYLINTFYLKQLNPFFANYFNDLLATIILFSFLNTILRVDDMICLLGLIKISLNIKTSALKNRLVFIFFVFVYFFIDIVYNIINLYRFFCFRYLFLLTVC